MAMNLNLSGSGAAEDIKKQVEKETNLKFKLVKYCLIALAAVIAVKSGVGIWSDYNAVQDLSVQIEQKQNSFEKLKTEVEAWHLEHDKASTNLDEESGKVISEVKLPSARDLGIETASLQNKLLESGGLLHDDEQRLIQLVNGRFGSAQAWFGAALEPGAVEWEFATWYDGEADAEAYECVWQCWRTEEGTDYLVAIAVGTFNVRNENFSVNTVYVTNFGTMLVQNGAIKARPADNADTDPDGVGQMVDELTGNGDGSEGDGSEGDGSGNGDEGGDGGVVTDPNAGNGDGEPEPEGDGEPEEPNAF